jgi:hypothetical protein
MLKPVKCMIFTIFRVLRLYTAIINNSGADFIGQVFRRKGRFVRPHDLRQESATRESNPFLAWAHYFQVVDTQG